MSRLDVEVWLLPTGEGGIAVPHGLCKYVAGWCACETCVAARQAFEARYIASRRWP